MTTSRKHRGLNRVHQEPTPEHTAKATTLRLRRMRPGVPKRPRNLVTPKNQRPWVIRDRKIQALTKKLRAAQ